MISKRRLVFLMMAGLCVSSLLRAQGVVDYGVRTEESVSGRLLAGGVEFSALSEAENFVVVSIAVKDSLEIRAEIDYEREEFSIKALSQNTGSPVRLGKADREALKNLALSAHWNQARRPEEALASTLNLLDSYPAGEVVDLSTVGRQGGEKGYVSLCDKTGKPATGTYTVKQKVFKETAQLGPCYSKPNECLGRCGKGCSGDPGDSIQRFTQDCLNHDFCTRKTGDIFGECFDEFKAASDDFFFAPDCGTLQGSWSDNYGFEWTLQQGTSVSGQVKTTECLVWRVTGTHKGADLKLSARNPRETGSCCKAFSYTGKINSCNAASGDWKNACGLSGTWTLVREGTKERFLFTTNGQESSTPTGRN